MIEFALTLMMLNLCVMLGVAVRVFGVMFYDQITAKPFVSHKRNKWVEIKERPLHSVYAWTLKNMNKLMGELK